jgi:spoIIIJ-associated protein
MKWVEAEGDSIDAAIESALGKLGVSRDRVEVEIIANASRGLFGIGGRKARIKATLRGPIDAAHTLTDDEGAVPDASGGAPPSGRTSAGPESAGTEAAPPANAATVEHAREVLQQIVQHMGVDARVAARAEDERVVLELSGDSSGILIGRRGQMLDALEYVVNRIVGRDEGSAVHTLIDSENYRARRRSALEDLARRMADQAKKKRRQVTLNPMSPRDRRIVHLVLQNDRSLTTRSTGKGYYRKLIIIPEGAGRAARGES